MAKRIEKDKLVDAWISKSSSSRVIEGRACLIAHISTEHKEEVGN
jgi:hypothetical protein